MAQQQDPDWAQEPQQVKEPDWAQPVTPAPAVSFSEMAKEFEQSPEAWKVPDSNLTTGIPFIDWPVGALDASVAGAADMLSQVSRVPGAYAGAAMAAFTKDLDPVDIMSKEMSREQEFYAPQTEAGKILYDVGNWAVGHWVQGLGDLAYWATGGSPRAGFLGTMAGVASTLVLGKVAEEKASAKFGSLRDLGSEFNVGVPREGATPALWAHYFKNRYPETFANLERSAVGKPRVSAGRSIWASLDEGLNRELAAGDFPLPVEDMGVRQKMLIVMQKADLKSEMPQATKEQIVDKYLEGIREIELASTALRGSLPNRAGMMPPDVIRDVESTQHAVTVTRKALRTEGVDEKVEPGMGKKLQAEDLIEKRTEPTTAEAIPNVFRKRERPAAPKEPPPKELKYKELVDLAARLGRRMDDPILPFIAAGLTKPVATKGLVRVYRPSVGEGDKISASDWVTTNPEVAAEKVKLYYQSPDGTDAGITSMEVPSEHIFRMGADGYVYAPPGTDIGQIAIGKMKNGTPVTMRQMLDKVTKEPFLPGMGEPAGSAKLRAVYKESIAQEEKLYSTWNRGIIRKLHTVMMDHSGEVKGALLAEAGSEGKIAVREFELMAGTPMYAMREYRAAYGKVFDGLTQQEERLIDQYANARRIVEIDRYKGKRYKHAGNVTGDEAQEFLNYESSQNPEGFKKLNNRVDRLFTVYRKQLEDLLTDGVITPESFTRLYHFDYEPQTFMKDLIDDLDPVTLRDKKINPHSVRDSGIESLLSGKDDIRLINSRALLADTISRGQWRIAKNRANQALHAFAQKNTDNGWVQAVADDKLKWNDRGDLVNDVTAPSGFVRIDARIEGKVKPMFLERGLAEGWASRPRSMVPIMEDLVRAGFGTMFVRPLATTYNPGFFLTNFPRDMLTAWLNSDAYSPIAPVAVYQGLKAGFHPDVLKAAWGRRGPLLESYFANGGGQSMMTHQGRNFLSARRELPGEMLNKNPRIEGVKDALSYINESGELWVRTTMQKHLESQGMSTRDAVWQSRRFLDYAQGGVVSKGVDTMIPFFNASMQAMRGAARQAKENPVKFAAKVGQITGAVTLWNYGQMRANPEGWAQIDTNDKINNVIIWTGMSSVDDLGTKQWDYLKLPIDQSLVPFTAAMQAANEKVLFGKVPNGFTLDAISKMSSAFPTGSLPFPVPQALVTYWSGKNFWTDQDVWRGTKNVSPYLEYTVTGKEPTPDLWKNLGSYGMGPDQMQQFGLEGFSPVRLQAASRQVLPNNEWVAMAGKGYDVLFGEIPPGAEKIRQEEMLNKQPMIRKLLKKTHPANKDSEEVNRIERIENDRQKQQMDQVKVLMFQERDALRAPPNSRQFKDSVDKIVQYARSQPPEDADRLEHYVVRTTVYDNIVSKMKTANQTPSRNWWYNTMDAQPRVRAHQYWTRYVSVPRDAQKQMDQISAAFTAGGLGYRSEDFDQELAKIKDTYGTDSR